MSGADDTVAATAASIGPPGPPAGPLVEIVGAEKRFGSNAVLRGIDLVVGEHEAISLIGASGSGKSTLLRCINGLEPLDAGTVTVAGIRVIQDDAALNRDAALGRASCSRTTTSSPT